MIANSARDEDDRRQELEREDHAEARVRLAQLAEDELGADVGVVEDAGDEAAQRAEQLPGRRESGARRWRTAPAGPAPTPPPASGWRRRLCDSATPMARMSDDPEEPESRVQSETGARRRRPGAGSARRDGRCSGGGAVLPRCGRRALHGREPAPGEPGNQPGCRRAPARSRAATRATSREPPDQSHGVSIASLER